MPELTPCAWGHSKVDVVGYYIEEEPMPSEHGRSTSNNGAKPDNDDSKEVSKKVTLRDPDALARFVSYNSQPCRSPVNGEQ